MSFTVTPIKTEVVKPGDNLEDFLLASIKSLPEKSILVVTSKIVALCENRVVKKKLGNRWEKQNLVKREADFYLDPKASQYDLMLTIKDGTLAVNAGVDESNVDQAHYVLLPADSFASAQKIWQFCRQQFKVKELGVIISDSKTFPLKWGVIGTALAFCGFKGLKSQIGQPDIFGREMKMTQINVAEALAVAAVFNMGETNQTQPLAIISQLPAIVEFTDLPPLKQEIDGWLIEPADDVYAQLLMSVNWLKGGRGNAQ